MASLFFALLALTALVGAAGLVGLGIATRSDPDGPAAALLDDLSGPALGLAAVVATTATVGSLWFSEVAGYTPCTLCWYQRIAMYPLAPILGLAAVRDDRSIRPYGAVLAVSGAVIAAYHVVVQRVPNVDSVGCSPDAPCSALWVDQFGFVSIPVMALCGFLAVLALLWVAGREPAADDDALEVSEEVVQ